MAGIYIHIPFCKQACSYCDFHFSTSIKRKGELVKAICKEIELQKDYLNQEKVQSIYFGGGTPSLLSKEETNAILDQIYKFHSISEDVEITLEANPDDLNLSKLTELKHSGINRLSIGIQSFFEEDLRFMNRAHNAEQAHNAIKISQDVGFNNISIDLIYGSPTTTNNMWEQNLAFFFEHNVPHLSSYCLSVEQKTKLHHLIEKGEVLPPPESKAIEQFNLLQKSIRSNDFEQYEVSNFCKLGIYSRHNTSYWQNTPYLGLGPSAHSFNTKSRKWNIANNALYLKGINNNTPNFEVEHLTELDKINELIMTRMRTKWGLNIEQVSKQFDDSLIGKLFDNIQNLNVQEMCNVKKDTITLKPQYFIYSDRIIRELFIL